MITMNERRMIESWKTDLMTERRVQPALTLNRSRLAATGLRTWLQRRRAAGVVARLASIHLGGT
jgi:hypothetical protein